MQKTAYEMRISYWSSDVCSSDLAVEVAAVLGLVVVELRDQLAGARLEARSVRIRPPVLHVAAGTELGALVVVAVGHLVADHRTDAAVVERVAGVRVEARRLQDRGGDCELVGQRVVGRVDRLRANTPFGLVPRLAPLAALGRSACWER